MALDVVEVQLRDQAELEAVLLALDGKIANVGPGDAHALVLHVAQPAAEDRHPVPEPQCSQLLRCSSGPIRRRRPALLAAGLLTGEQPPEEGRARRPPRGRAR